MEVCVNITSEVTFGMEVCVSYYICELAMVTGSTARHPRSSPLINSCYAAYQLQGSTEFPSFARILNNIGAWPCSLPSYCKKLTLAWVELEHAHTGLTRAVT